MSRFDQKGYCCGHCNREVTSKYLTGFENKDGMARITPPSLLSCPECGKDSVVYATPRESSADAAVGEGGVAFTW